MTLKTVLQSVVNELADRLEQEGPIDVGILDLQLISTTRDGDSDACTVRMFGTELIELANGSWVVEETYQKRSQN